MLRLLSAVGPHLWVVQTSALPELIVPNVPDLTIRVRRLSTTPEGIAVTQTLAMSFHGARARRDVEMLYGPSRERSVFLEQCDQHQDVTIYPAFHTYDARPIESPRATAERM